MKSFDHSFERRLAIALHETPTPDGLRERLLSAVLSVPVDSADSNLGGSLSSPSRDAGSCEAAVGSPKSADGERVTIVRRASRFLRRRRGAAPRGARKISRRLALAAGALAASLLVGGFAWWNLRTVVDPRADLATLAANWVPQLSNIWKPMSGAPSGLPASTALSGAPHGWQPATKIVGSAAVVYDISRPGVRAVLFAVRMVAPQLPFGPPAAPFSTGGQAIATWRSGALVYVLVVEGDEQSYRSLIRSVAPALA